MLDYHLITNHKISGDPGRPSGALVYYVDSVSGSDTNSGETWATPFVTIQKAITMQIANTNGTGDVIYVAPGNYVEDLTGNLTKVQLIGATCGGTPEVVSIRPTAGSAYTGVLENASIRNIDFRQSSSTNPAQAVLELTDMFSSIVDNCAITGVSNTANSMGILIGSDTAASGELMFNSKISNCLISTFGARTSEFEIGISIGQTDTQNASRKFSNSVIQGNRIFAEVLGIALYTAAANNPASVIDKNWVSSNQGQCSTAGIKSISATDTLCMVTRNYIRGVDAIAGFTDDNVLDNWVANDGTPAVENPAQT